MTDVHVKGIKIFGPREIKVLEQLMLQVMRDRSGAVRLEVAPKHLLIGGCVVYVTPLNGELDAKFNQVIQDVTGKSIRTGAGAPPQLGKEAKET